MSTGKYLGPGVTYSPTTKMYTAKLGVKTIGEYKSLEGAAEAYNDNAKRIFTFPILNKNHIPIEEVFEKVIVEDTLVKENTVELKGTVDPVLDMMLLNILGVGNE